MNNQRYLAPVIHRLAATTPVRRLSLLGASEVLGWVGLARQRRRAATGSAFVAAGVLLGAAAVLLFTPASGREMRSRLGKRTGGTLGKKVGEQIGAHPVATAKVLQGARDVFSPKHT